MKVKQYDDVILKDGRKAGIIEVFSDTHFMADVGSGPNDWETIDIDLKDIESVIEKEHLTK